jgi:DNA-binding transcriptional MerR regulator
MYLSISELAVIFGVSRVTCLKYLTLAKAQPVMFNASIKRYSAEDFAQILLDQSRLRYQMNAEQGLAKIKQIIEQQNGNS